MRWRLLSVWKKKKDDERQLVPDFELPTSDFELPSMGGSYAGAGSPRRRNGTPTLFDVGFVFCAKRLDRRQHGRRRGVTERAERLAQDVVADREQQIEVFHLPFAAL